MHQSSAHRRLPARHRGTSPFWPLLLLSLTLISWLGFQSYQLMDESRQLAQMRFAQEAQVEAASKLRSSLDSVATATAKLADSGNLNARILVAELRNRGITINPAAPATR